MSAEHVRLERDGDVAELVIASPPLNLFGGALVPELRDALGEAQGSGARALLLRAEGDVFSAGADVAIFDGLDHDGASALVGELMKLAHLTEDLPFPTLSLVQGLCLTAGFELSLACDLLWAGQSARFGLVEAVIGITPLMGGTQRLVERAGTARARELVMTRGLYDAETMLGWGVVNRVLADDELLEKGRRFAARLAAGPTLAHLATKRVVRAAADHGTRGADERTAELTAGLFETQDLREGLTSFRSEGPGQASFSGR